MTDGDLLSLIPREWQPIATTVLQIFDSQDKAIKQLQAEIKTLKSNGHGNVTVPASNDVLINDEIPVANHNGNGNGGGSVGDLLQTINLIKSLMGQGGNGDMTATIQKMVEQREMLDRLIPPDPMREFTTKIGASFLEQFTKRLGQMGFDNMFPSGK